MEKEKEIKPGALGHCYIEVWEKNRMSLRDRGGMEVNDVMSWNQEKKSV